MTTFKDKILGFSNQDGTLKKQAIEYLANIRTFKSFKDFKEVIYTMLEFEDFQKFYNDKIVKHIEYNYVNQIFPASEMELFVKELLLHEIRLGEKYSFYYAIYTKLKENSEFKFPITEQDLKDLCLIRLRRFVKKGEDDIEKCSNLYYLCRDKVNDKQIVNLQIAARRYMRRYIDNYPWSYINFLIRPYGIPIYTSVNSEFTIEPFVEFTFDGWDNFWDFLNDFKENKLYAEHQERFSKYCNFFEQFKANKYKPVPVNKNDYKKYGIDSLIVENQWPVVNPSASEDFV